MTAIGAWMPLICFNVNLDTSDYTKTAVYTVFEAVNTEVKHYGVRVIRNEVVGFVPMRTRVDCTEYYLRIEGFPAGQLLEDYF